MKIFQIQCPNLFFTFLTLLFDNCGLTQILFPSTRFIIPAGTAASSINSKILIVVNDVISICFIISVFHAISARGNFHEISNSR